MPDSIENLLKRTGDQLRASAEHRVAADKCIAMSTEIIRLTHESVVRSRRQIARLHRRKAAEDNPPPLLGPRNRSPRLLPDLPGLLSDRNRNGLRFSPSSFYVTPLGYRITHPGAGSLSAISKCPQFRV
jgi:hypothetical protein